MNREDLLGFLDAMHEAEKEIVRRKNHDYAGARADADPFANFRRTEALGICTVEQGMMVRISDKFSRLAEFQNSGKLLVLDESVLDTIHDARNYLGIMAAYISGKGKGDGPQAGKQDIRACDEAGKA